MKKVVFFVFVICLNLFFIIGCDEKQTLPENLNCGEETTLLRIDNSINSEIEDKNSSPQLEIFEIFQDKVISNIYDEWLNQSLANGQELTECYAKYSRFWENEFNYSITIAESLFVDSESYLQWKNELEIWLETTTNIVRIESNQAQGQVARLEIIIEKSKLIREKVIDIKYFCYVLEHSKLDVTIDNPIGLQWLNNLEE